MIVLLPGAQICCTSLSASRLRRGKPWRSVEAVQARGLDHPGIVRTYKTTNVLVQVRIQGSGSRGCRPRGRPPRRPKQNQNGIPQPCRPSFGGRLQHVDYRLSSLSHLGLIYCSCYVMHMPPRHNSHPSLSSAYMVSSIRSTRQATAVRAEPGG